MSVTKSREKLHGKSEASLWRNLSTDTLPNFFSTILCFVALLQFIFFFQKSRFAEIIRHLILIQTLYKFLTCLPTGQDDLENRDKIYTQARRFF